MKSSFFFMIFFILVITENTWAGLTVLSEKERYDLEEKKIISPPIAPMAPASPLPQRKKQETNSLQMKKLLAQMKKLQKEDEQRIKKLDELKKSKNIEDKKPKTRIIALSRFKGVLLNSLVATNWKEVHFIVRANSYAGKIASAEFRCQGAADYNRIITVCDLMVLNGKEYNVSVKIWADDGADGILADKIFTSEEKNFLSSSFTSFMSGVLDASKDRFTTPFGQADASTIKNRILNGLVGVGGNANQKIAESSDRKLTVAVANSGQTIIIYFHNGVTL
jgi:hypothetical protein